SCVPHEPGPRVRVDPKRATNGAACRQCLEHRAVLGWGDPRRGNEPAAAPAVGAAHAKGGPGRAGADGGGKRSGRGLSPRAQGRRRSVIRRTSGYWTKRGLRGGSRYSKVSPTTIARATQAFRKDSSR